MAYQKEVHVVSACFLNAIDIILWFIAVFMAVFLASSYINNYINISTQILWKVFTVELCLLHISCTKLLNNQRLKPTVSVIVASKQ